MARESAKWRARSPRERDAAASCTQGPKAFQLERRRLRSLLSELGKEACQLRAYAFEVHRRANAEREDWKASCSTRWQNRSPPLWLLWPTVAGNREPGHR